MCKCVNNIFVYFFNQLLFCFSLIIKKCEQSLTVITVENPYISRTYKRKQRLIANVLTCKHIKQQLCALTAYLSVVGLLASSPACQCHDNLLLFLKYLKLKKQNINSSFEFMISNILTTKTQQILAGTILSSQSKIESINTV